MWDLYTLLLKVFHLPSISVGSLRKARIPELSWQVIWSRLSIASLPASAVDVAFSALHNILHLQVRPTGSTSSPPPPLCQAPMEDVVHFFTACPRLSEA
jgi:hypothetical protein